MLLSKVKYNEIIMFYRQFAVMLKAGISISDCFDNFQKQNFSVAFNKVLKSVDVDVNSGVSLSVAFAKHPRVFPEFFINMVSIGEETGTLDEIMTNMADYYENDRKIKKKVSSAMVYPTLLIFMVLLVSIFLCTFVLPQFESTITKLGGEVPKITTIILNISKFIQKYILLLLSGFAMFIVGIAYFFNTKKGKYIKDVIKVKCPIISDIEINLITARFSRAFVILLGSGMNMVDILENLRKMLGNEFYIRKFNNAIEAIKHGERMANSIADTKMFPQMLTEMINIGESSGNLEEVLESTGSYFEMQVESSIAKSVAIIEPVAVLILGFVVSLVVISVLIPIISMMNAI